MVIEGRLPRQRRPPSGIVRSFSKGGSSALTSLYVHYLSTINNHDTGHGLANKAVSIKDDGERGST